MEPTCKAPRLVFPEGFTDRDAWEMERKGFVYFDCNPFYPSGWPRRGGNSPAAACQW